MHKSVRLLVSALAMGVSILASAADYKPGEVIVKYKDSTFRSRTEMNSLYQFAGVKSVKRFAGAQGYEQLFLNDGMKVSDAIALLSKSDLVEYAQPNYILRLHPVARGPIPMDGEFPIPCIPGMEIPGCDDSGGGGGGGEQPPGGSVPCIFPGIPFPPGCEDSGMPGQPPGGGDGGGGTTPAPSRPAVQPAPADIDPPVADPQISQAYGLEKVGAIEAWKAHRGSKQIIVADIDTGVDYNHEDLSFNMWRNPNPGQKNDVVGYDFIHNDGLPFDDNQHGTHTSGTIGATGGNGKGVSGVSQRVSIMALKFLSGEGSGTTADAVRAIDYAVAHGAKILSNSWGGPGDEDNKALYDSIERAKARDVLFIAAAGNDSKNNDDPKQASYPAAFDNDNLISVAATDNKDKMAFFSNFGKKTVHVAAPGANVYSTTPGNKYQSFSGTSMACPHVAGAAALVWSKNPSLTYQQVKKLLMDTVDSLPSLQGKTITGGRINVAKALRSTERSNPRR